MIDFSLIEKKYESLSKNRRDLLFSQETSTILLKLAEENGLTEKGAEDFFDEIGLIILGINDENKFQEKLTKIVKDSSLKDTDGVKNVKTITSGVKTQIFDRLFNDSIEDTPATKEGVTQLPLETQPNKDIKVTLPEANLETKERLDLRPRVGGVSPSTANTQSAPVTVTKEAAKPLTREELMSALGGKRTMAQDIEAVRASREAAKSSWAPGTTNPPK